LLDLARHFSRFIEADPERIHFAAHSHHFWPDVTYDAQIRCWEDAARHADEKWEPIFSDLVPAVQAGIAGILDLPDPATIAVAPNTHEFLRRLLSALPVGRPSRILTTDGEFHSLARQLARLEEDGLVVAERVAVEPFDTFAERFATAAARGGHDLVYVSHIFFNSGAVAGRLEDLAGAVRDPETLIAVDGYHGFMAVPTDLSAVADRIFYLAGGYKYAMAGEGACFMHCPPGFAPRPRDTGWYAAFGALSARQTGVPYGEDGSRFLGATFDPSGLYRLRAVLAWVREIGLTVGDPQPCRRAPAALHGRPRRQPLARTADGSARNSGGLPEAGSFPDLRNSQGGGPLQGTPGEAHRHRRAGPQDPLRLRLLSPAGGHRPGLRASPRRGEPLGKRKAPRPKVCADPRHCVFL
jgi:selenocysteine lyase/cysteine desulfurase